MSATSSYMIAPPLNGLYVDGPLMGVPPTTARRVEGLRIKNNTIQTVTAPTSIFDVSVSGNSTRMSSLGNLLIVFADGGIESLDVGTGTSNSLYTNGGVADPRYYQLCKFKGYIFYNPFDSAGGAQSQGYTSSTTHSLSGWTIDGNPQSGFYYTCAHNGRLYHLTNPTDTSDANTNLYYGGVNSITGALTIFDIQSIMNDGGFPIALCPLSRNTGAGDVAQLAIFTSSGECLVYNGSYPGDASWSLAQRVKVPTPFFRGAYCDAVKQIGGDVWYISSGGIFSLTSILDGNPAVPITSWTSSFAPTADSHLSYASVSGDIFITPNYRFNIRNGGWSTGRTYADVHELKGTIYGITTSGGPYGIDTGTVSDAWYWRTQWLDLGTQQRKKIRAIRPLFNSSTTSTQQLSFKIYSDYYDTSPYQSTFQVENFVLSTTDSQYLPMQRTGRTFSFELYNATAATSGIVDIAGLEVIFEVVGGL